MSHSKDDAIAVSKRKNRAIRKLIRVDNIDPIFKMLVISIVDKLNHKSGYRVAWPSVPTLAKIIGRSERTTLRYLKMIYASEFFIVHRLSPEQAVGFMKEKFGIDVALERCRKFSPNLYEINMKHCLWNSSESFSSPIVNQLREITGTKES